MCDCLNLILSLCSQNVHTRCFLVSSWIVIVVAYPRTFLLPGQGLSNCRQGSHPTIGHLVYQFPWYSNYPVVGIYPNAVMGWFPIWWLYMSPLFTMFSLYVVKAPTSTPDRSPLISFCSSGLPLLGGKHFGSLHSSLWFLTLPCFVYSKSDVCRFFSPIASCFYEKNHQFLVLTTWMVKESAALEVCPISHPAKLLNAMPCIIR